MCRYHNDSGAHLRVPQHRLPDTVVPKHYDLRLSPDLASASYEGEVSIDILLKQAASEIELNASGTAAEGENTSPDLTVKSAFLTARDGTRFDCRISCDPQNEKLKLQVQGTVGKGSWKLHIAFAGRLNDKLKGFYRSRYKDQNGDDQVLACTQFEATDARRAFPCFDEPAMKATFQVTLVVDRDLEAVSNTRVLSSKQLAGGKKQLRFARTIKMSTYLLAFVVGKLKATKPVDVDGVKVRVYTIPGKEHLTSFAHEIAAYSLRYFTRYFGCPYPGDKMDLLSIPDFAAGAMENLGCVTFREESLLVDPQTASQRALDRVAEVVAHEIAHMWFGDLVTMDWWDGLWLNEAFATFMAAKCVDSWKQNWGVWEKFALARGTAMRTDALNSTRPIQFTVNHPDEAAAMFDVLTYEKGCSVMRMLEQYLGEESFRRGIAAYMDRHAYSNTKGDDLWKALSEASGQNVKSIMDGWVLKPGFPLVSARKADTAGSITVSQKPFKFLEAECTSAPQTWSMPLFLRAKTAEGEISKTFLIQEQEETLYLGEGLEWVLVNAGGHAFCRVSYEKQLADALTNSALSEMSVVERYNLLADSWACVRAGLSSTSDFLDMARLFAAEEDPNVWSAIIGALNSIREILPEGNRKSFETMVRELLRPLYTKLSFSTAASETAQIRELRASVIEALAHTGNDSEVKEKACELFAQWKQDRKVLDPNLVGSIIGICAANGDAELFDELASLLEKSVTPQDEQHFLRGLASFSDSSLLLKTLENALDPQKIRTQDAPFTVAAVMRNQAGKQHAWSFIKTNWQKLQSLYPESGLVRMCQAVSALDEAHQEEEVRDFFDANEVPSGRKQILQALEQLRINVLFRSREQASLLTSFPVQAPENKS